MVYLSGVIGLDSKTNQIVPGGVESETKQIMQNMEIILKAAGSGFDKRKYLVMDTECCSKSLTLHFNLSYRSKLLLSIGFCLYIIRW